MTTKLWNIQTERVGDIIVVDKPNFLSPQTCHLSIAIVMSMEYWSGRLQWLIIVYLSQSCVRDHLGQNLEVRNQKWRIKTRRNIFWSINNVVVVTYCPYQLKWCPGSFGAGKGRNLEVRGQKLKRKRSRTIFCNIWWFGNIWCECLQNETYGCIHIAWC